MCIPLVLLAEVLLSSSSSRLIGGAASALQDESSSLTGGGAAAEAAPAHGMQCSRHVVQRLPPGSITSMVAAAVQQQLGQQSWVVPHLFVDCSIAPVC